MDVAICKKQVPGIGGLYLDGQLEAKTEHSVDVLFNGKEQKIPAWVAFDRKVLRFYAFFQEAVEERREEQFRIRKVNIYFYLEDDTIHVSEPKVQNSGIPNGTLIRRHHILKSQTPENTQHFLFTDLNVSKEVTFYGKTFKIIGCDAFTRVIDLLIYKKEFLSNLGIQVPINGEYPSDPHTLVRQELKARMKARRPYQPELRLRQFLENDRKVLRFYCLWDDTNNIYGTVHKMKIHYYLSDETIEITECGATLGSSFTFLRRCRLPKRMPSSTNSVVEYYTDKDFIIGTVIHLYGRPFIICDCDEFTKYYYAENYGLENFYPVTFEGLQTSEETSSNESLEQRIEKSRVGVIGQGIIAPKPTFDQQTKYDGSVLRFSARKVSDNEYERERKFIISVFAVDNTISVFEKLKSGGSLGGKFLEKGRIRKYPTTEFYTLSDFGLGVKLCFYGNVFEIYDADECAKLFMVDHPELFGVKNRN